jgi:CheY-like chemotaxis protein
VLRVLSPGLVCVAEGERRVEERPIILVVEVDETIQELVRDALTEGGYQPAMVASAHEAVTLLQSGQADYRALVIDIYPSGSMNSWEAARKARKIAPDLPVVYMTAGAGNEWPSEGVPSSVLLQKPFALAQLVTAVSQLLITGSTPPRTP